MPESRTRLPLPPCLFTLNGQVLIPQLNHASELKTFNPFSFLRGREDDWGGERETLWGYHTVSPFQFLTYTAEFIETSYEYYVIAGHPNIVTFDFV
jgi:hypothetical protein